MAELKDREYAFWLEDFLQKVSEDEPEKILVAYKADDGILKTGYWGCDVEDKATFAHNVYMDAVMDTVLANADQVVRRAQEMEEDD